MDKQTRIQEINHQIKELQEEKKRLNGVNLEINKRIQAIAKDWRVAEAVGVRMSYIARSVIHFKKHKYDDARYSRVTEFRNMSLKEQELVKEFVDSMVDLYHDFYKRVWEMNKDEE